MRISCHLERSREGTSSDHPRRYFLLSSRTPSPMRFLRKLLLWIIGIVLLLIVLAYATGNGHLVRGVRFTYLMGRNGPEIDDRDFFPYAAIPAEKPQPWPQDKRYGKLSVTPEQEKALAALSTVGFVVVQN